MNDAELEKCLVELLRHARNGTLRNHKIDSFEKRLNHLGVLPELRWARIVYPSRGVPHVVQEGAGNPHTVVALCGRRFILETTTWLLKEELESVEKLCKKCAVLVVE